MNADGSDVRQLTSSWYDSFPSWSPDGNRIMFSRSSTYFSGRIYTISPDGTGLSHISNIRGYQQSYSPNGQRIAFVQEFLENNAGTSSVIVADTDGSNQTEVTTRSARNEYPNWR
jgi:TolB protein